MTPWGESPADTFSRPEETIWQLEEGASVFGLSLGDGINEVQVSDTDAEAAEEKRFLRLRVE